MRGQFLKFLFLKFDAVLYSVLNTSDSVDKLNESQFSQVS